MNVNELRVGNYIDNNVECFQIQAKDLIFLLAFDNEHYANPIPLTDNWIKNFGFKLGRYNHEGWIELDSLCLSEDRYSEGQYRLGFDDSEYGVGEFTIKIKYVHQLQNIYFYSTGKELITK